jgi:hypothetical protein
MSAFGLSVCQPFAALVGHYMQVPVEFLNDANAKWTLNGSLVEAHARPHVGRKKTRAQVGGADFGTLGVYHRLGLNDAALLNLWRRSFPGETASACDGLIQFGRYRMAPFAK